MAASLASAPLLQKKHWPPNDRSESACGERALGFHVPGVGHVDQLADLVADRLDDPGRAVAEQVAAPAGEEVEVAVPLGVPDPRTLAPDQADREPPVVGDHVPLELGDRLLRALVGS